MPKKTQPTPALAPIIDGLEVFEIVVDGTGDFPVPPGKWIVRYVLLPCPGFNTPGGVFEDIKRRNLTRPNRVDAETILDARRAESWSTIVGIVGLVNFKYEPLRVSAVSDNRGCKRSRDRITWDWPLERYYRFIAIVSRVPMIE